MKFVFHSESHLKPCSGFRSWGEPKSRGPLGARFAILVSLVLVCLSAKAGPPFYPWTEETRSTEDQVFRGYETIETTSPSTKTGLDASERQQLFTLSARDKVASIASLDHYDQQNIGFCFGRAMAAHLIARGMGLGSDSIRKLFIIGDLRSGADPEWRFHVTTLVRGSEDGGWYAVDPALEYLDTPVTTAIPMQEHDLSGASGLG